jgi:hypothetical protein
MFQDISMPNFPGSEQWMIGSGYEILAISSIEGPNLNELSAPIHNSRPDPILSIPFYHFALNNSCQ